jgi:quercetin dioxygenase-like cupin family protein
MKKCGFLLAIVMFALTASAQDAAKVNPKTITVRLDNAKVRVLEAVLPPGAKEHMHSHPSSIVYVLSNGTFRSHTPDGKTTESTVKAGDVLYREPLTHWAENTGTTPLHMLVVELKPVASAGLR